MQLYIISVMSILHTCTAPLMTKDLQAPATLIGTLVQLRANTANYVVAAPCRHGQVQNEHHKRQKVSGSILYQGDSRTYFLEFLKCFSDCCF